MKDSLGDRMKSSYEDRYRYSFPRRTYLILRIDGRAFHTYTRGLEKPFDVKLMEAMAHTAQELVKQISGAKFAYTQSDEISILLTDFDSIETQAFFDGNIQKIVSVAASTATAEFNFKRFEQLDNSTHSKQLKATFDARGFIIPDRTEVSNYFIWRQKDCTRNSLSSLAQYHFSHRELEGKNQSSLHEMLHTKGVNWAKLETEKKQGYIITRNNIEPAFDFLKERTKLVELIPMYGDLEITESIEI